MKVDKTKWENALIKRFYQNSKSQRCSSKERLSFNWEISYYFSGKRFHIWIL